MDRRGMAFGDDHGQRLLSLPQSLPVFKPCPHLPSWEIGLRQVLYDLAGVAAVTTSVVFCKPSTEGHHVCEVTTGQEQSPMLRTEESLAGTLWWGVAGTHFCLCRMDNSHPPRGGPATLTHALSSAGSGMSPTKTSLDAIACEPNERPLGFEPLTMKRQLTDPRSIPDELGVPSPSVSSVSRLLPSLQG